MNLSHKQKNVNDSQGNLVLRTALLALAVTGASMLAACGDSPAATADKKAAEASDRAARISRSAGEPRPNDNFVKITEDITPENFKAKQKEILAKITPANFNQYFTVKPVEVELKAAADELGKGVTSDASAAQQFIGKLQAGSIAIAQANEKLAKAESILRDMAAEAALIQVIADELAGIGGDASVFEARKSLDNSAAINETKTTLDTAKQAASAADSKVQSLEKTIAEKKSQAGEIYQRTDAAFVAADAIKGKAAIEAYEKAAAERKNADALSEEVAKLSLELRQAQGDAAVAKIRETEAQAQLDALNAAATAGQAYATKSTEGATEMRSAAKKLLEQENTGLAARVKKFEELSSKLEAAIGDALTDAKRATSAYSDARKQWDANKADIAKLEIDATKNDPLTTIANDRRRPALTQLSQSIAQYTAGRANIAGWLGNRISASVAEAHNRGLKAAGLTAVTPTTNPAERSATYMEAAKTSLSESINTANQPATVTDMPLPWLANSVLAQANWAYFIVSGDNSYKTTAEEKARTAQAANPDLKFGSILK